MRNIIILFLLLFSISVFAQSPQSFQYQAVVRDALGTALVNQSVNFRISILSGSVTGTTEYVEIHNGVTNAYGVVLLSIGSGSPTLGTLSGINWGTNSYFIKVEADPAGGTSFLDMGTTQLLSVPYALYSEKAGNVPVYTGGSGIDVTGTTITNTNPDQAVILSGTGATSVTGTYPNFTINSTDNNTTYSAGSGLSLTGTTFANTAPDQSVTITSGTGISITGSYPSFTVTNSSPNATHTGDVTGATALTIANGAVTAAKLNTMSATNGQVLKFNGTNWAPSTDLNAGTPGGVNKSVQFNNAGSFAGNSSFIWDNTNERLGIGSASPSGRVVIQGSPSALASAPLFEIKNSSGQQIMAVYNDSIHFFITDIASNQGGFAVSGRNNSKALTNDFLRINADSTRIWTSDTLKGFGVRNIGATSKTSYMQLTPQNYFIGHEAGKNITSGKYNSIIGYQAGKVINSGIANTFLGYQAGYSNTSGKSNIFAGARAGYYNTSGKDNIFIGDSAGYSNVTSIFNVYVGSACGRTAVGNGNTLVGCGAGELATTGDINTFVGNGTGIYNHGSENTFIGAMSGMNNTTGARNVYLGTYAGNNILTGSNNIFIGYLSGNAETGSNRLYIENSGANSSSALIYGEFDNDLLRFNANVGIGITPVYKLHVSDIQATGFGTGLGHFVNLATSNDAAGVFGSCKSTDYYGYGGYFEGGYMGVYGRVVSTGSNSYRGVFGAVTGTGTKYGLYGSATGTGTNYGVYGSASGGTTNYAGYFNGDVHVNGTLSKSAGTFRIDHPQDPENKYLVHSFVESPEMKNIYDGEIVLDENGEAIIELPGYFEVLNKDFRYQLTAIGSAAPNLFIKQRVQNNKFVISGGAPGLSVSWQISGVRKDPYAVKNPIVVEEEKLPEDKGYYLNPELYNQSSEKSIHKAENKK